MWFLKYDFNFFWHYSTDRWGAGISFLTHLDRLVTAPTNTMKDALWHVRLGQWDWAASLSGSLRQLSPDASSGPSPMLWEAWANGEATCQCSGDSPSLAHVPGVWVKKPPDNSGSQLFESPAAFTSSQLRLQTSQSRDKPPCCALSKFLRHVCKHQ